MFKKRKIDYLIIGAQKSGTTSLYEYINAHLMALPARKKEVHYFDKHAEEGPKWYHERFNWKEEGLRGEATPYYLFDEKCPNLVHQYSKDIRLITILRDPIERAFSHYRMNVGRGDEDLSFMEALEAEEQRLQDSSQQINRLYSYKKRGLYLEQLNRWTGLFHKEQMLVLKYEDFFENPWHNVQKVYSFLGLAPYYGSQQDFFSNQNVGNIDMPEDAKNHLRQYFAEPNKKLAQQFNIHFE